MTQLKMFEPVQAHRIPDDKRINALPHYFPRKYMQVERTIFALATKLCDEYKGGYWDYYTLDNGGFYMAPNLKAKMLKVEWDENYFEGTVTPDALGVIACLFTYSMLAYDNPQAGEQFHWLREFALDHAEAAAIFRAID